MKVEIKEAKKEFKPVTVEITFEERNDLYLEGEGFIYRFDQCRESNEGGNWVSTDNTCKAIRKALKEAGY